MEYILKIYRGTPGHQYYEEFVLPYDESDNVISALMKIRTSPINKKGEKVEPVVWEDGCLEEVCGSCSMLINGKPRQACTALIGHYLKHDNFIVLAPFTKYPLVRDLIVDRSRMFENFKKVNAWIDTEGSKDGDFGPLIAPSKQKVMYRLSTCMACGCCVEACPQVNEHSPFIGPAAISQARLFNAHPTGKHQRSRRLRPLLENGGISDCGNAQNCVEVCPKKIPLTDSIAAISRDVTLEALRGLFDLPDRED